MNLRPYGTDLAQPPRSSHLDETFLALIMLGSALAFSAVFLGPWGWLKLSAYQIGSYAWLVYAASFLALNLLVLPGVFTLCVAAWKKISRSSLPLKRLVSKQAQGLLPLGLLAWMAFTISFALPKLSYVFGVLNDPFGWGWRLLGAGNTTGSLDVARVSLLLQILLLVVGVYWSARVTRNLSQADGKFNSMPNIPILAFYLVYAGAFAWLLAG